MGERTIFTTINLLNYFLISFSKVNSLPCSRGVVPDQADMNRELVTEAAAVATLACIQILLSAGVGSQSPWQPHRRMYCWEKGRVGQGERGGTKAGFY